MMKSRSLFIITILLISALVLSCSERRVEHEHPKLSLNTDTIDFGDISANDPIAFHEASISAENQGKETLLINDIELPEGFSYELIPSRKEIEGGEKANLKIIMDVRKVSGPVSATAYVVCNAPDQPKVPIGLTANVVDRPVASALEDAPDIDFHHKTIDFGPLGRSKMVEHQFPFTNRGGKTLKIVGIDTMCMCIVAYTTKVEVPPGESAAIVARLEPYKYEGNNPWKTLNISTNDPDEQIVNLSVAAVIIDEAVLEPDVVLLPNLQQGHEAKTSVKLLQRGSRELLVKNIQSSSPHISITASPLTDGDTGHLLEVRISPDLPAGQFEEIVTVFTNYEDYSPRAKPGLNVEVYKDYSRLRLPIKGLVSGAVSISPQRINFGSCSPGEVVKRKLTLSSTASNLEIRAVSSTDPAFRATPTPVEPGRKYEVMVEFLAAPPDREISGELIISTTAGDLAVPLFAAVKQI
jgi:hypothetical protein